MSHREAAADVIRRRQASSPGDRQHQDHHMETDDDHDDDVERPGSDDDEEAPLNLSMKNGDKDVTSMNKSEIESQQHGHHRGLLGIWSPATALEKTASWLERSSAVFPHQTNAHHGQNNSFVEAFSAQTHPHHHRLPLVGPFASNHHQKFFDSYSAQQRAASESPVHEHVMTNTVGNKPSTVSKTSRRKSSTTRKHEQQQVIAGNNDSSPTTGNLSMTGQDGHHHAGMDGDGVLGATTLPNLLISGAGVKPQVQRSRGKGSERVFEVSTNDPRHT